VAGGSEGVGMNQLNVPRGVTVDYSGNVYVADTGNNRIMRWLLGATSGTVIVGGRGSGVMSDQLQTPTDLQFDGNGNLYVADSSNERVQKFTLDNNSC
jgi:DNA-binding beta-propeller fold protein YncE